MPAATPLEIRRFDHPDNQLDFDRHGRIDIIKLADGTSGFHAVLEPGWNWAEDEKPLLGNPESCPMTHIGYCIAGEVEVRMVESGERRVIRAGDFFELPPGHDAEVRGDTACELIMFAPPEA
jgi:hypothetical protein